ncbi:MAG: hypothetical protein HRU36_00865 [Rickettsiales bacterium]|nr:hypothetical protein [Rickettsiales bacterium]
MVDFLQNAYNVLSDTQDTVYEFYEQNISPIFSSVYDKAIDFYESNYFLPVSAGVIGGLALDGLTKHMKIKRINEAMLLKPFWFVASATTTAVMLTVATVEEAREDLWQYVQNMDSAGDYATICIVSFGIIGGIGGGFMGGVVALDRTPYHSCLGFAMSVALEVVLNSGVAGTWGAIFGGMVSGVGALCYNYPVISLSMIGGAIIGKKINCLGIGGVVGAGVAYAYNNKEIVIDTLCASQLVPGSIKEVICVAKEDTSSFQDIEEETNIIGEDKAELEEVA